MSNAAPIPLERDSEQAQGTERDREVLHELAPDSLIIVCETCESYWTFDPRTSDIALGGFREDHEQHLGHRPNETVRAREYFDTNEATFIEWAVDCETCRDHRTFSVYEQAEDFALLHQVHTGHQPGDPHKRYSNREVDRREAIADSTAGLKGDDDE